MRFASGARFGLFLLVALLLAAPAHSQTWRIINGADATEGEWPWMVTIFGAGGNPSSPAYGHFCGGVLVSPMHVVTAAHCVSEQIGHPEDLEVVVGRTKLSSSEGSRRLIQSVVLHPNFDPFLLQGDIAILKMSSPVSQQPIELVGSGDENLWTPGTMATILGWGRTNPFFPLLPDTLQEALVPIQSDLTCQENLGRFFEPAAHLCAGTLASFPGSDDGVDACNGDSGSPMLVPDGAGWKVAALTSWGFECASSEFYGAYTRVASYAAWVYTFPPAVPFLRTFVSLGEYEEASVGTTLTCMRGEWVGEDLQFTYQWRRSGFTESTAIPGAQSETYIITQADVDRSVFCEVTATNASGVLSTISETAGPVFEIVVTPVPTVSPLDITGPLTSKRVAFCKKRRCQIDVDADDDLSNVAGVEGTLVFEPRGCSGGASSSKACKSASALRIFDANITDVGAWRFTFSVKKPGRGQLRVRARDTSGNIQLRPTKVKFSAT